MRTGRKKYLKTGKQHIQGWKKGNFSDAENATFIDLLKKGTPYSVISVVLNRNIKLLSKQKYKLKKKGIDLTPYPDTSPTLFDQHSKTDSKPVLKRSTKEELENSAYAIINKASQNEKQLDKNEKDALNVAIKKSSKKEPTNPSRYMSDADKRTTERETLIKEYYEKLIIDKDKKSRLEELKLLLIMLRSNDTTKEAIARYIEGRALELNGFIADKKRRK